MGDALRASLMGEIDEQASTASRFYRLGANWRSRIEHVGSKASYDPDGPAGVLSVREPGAPVHSLPDGSRVLQVI